MMESIIFFFLGVAIVLILLAILIFVPTYFYLMIKELCIGNSSLANKTPFIQNIDDPEIH